jgi:hypothetical protein
MDDTTYWNILLWALMDTGIFCNEPGMGFHLDGFQNVYFLVRSKNKVSCRYTAITLRASTDVRVAPIPHSWFVLTMLFYVEKKREEAQKAVGLPNYNKRRTRWMD